MTFCKVLATAERGQDVITAYERTEKYIGNCTYEIVISRDGFAYLVEKAAKTTWRKKFDYLSKEN